MASASNTTENTPVTPLHFADIEMVKEARRRCYSTNETHNSSIEGIINKNELYCDKIFDGFSCWNKTMANTTVFQKCPNFIIGFDPKRTSFKTCLEDGTWFEHPESGRPWTNYTTCIDYEDLHFRATINNMYVGGYAISLIALIFAMIVFFYFRSLDCVRTRVHEHLFAAFICNNIFWITWYKSVVENVTVVQENTVWCQILHLMTTYFMLTSYLWMFIEGLHLHVALVIVFVKEDYAVEYFNWIGWGLPAVLIAVYAGVRMNLELGTERCWIEPSKAFWILAVPVALSLGISFIFLVNVLRVLLKKMHPTPSEQPSVALKKAARATAILIPLFGLHFLLIPFRPSPDLPGERVYQVVSCVLTSLQGLCVAILFCFTNHDVKVAFSTYLARHRRANEMIPMTGITTGESVLNSREQIG